MEDNANTNAVPKPMWSEVFPGTAQQFRAQMQRLYNRCVIPLWPPAMEDQFLVRQTRGRWESSSGDRLVFREERQLEPTQLSDGLSGDISFGGEPETRADITPETRTTWAVFMLPRKQRRTEMPQRGTQHGRTVIHHVSNDGEELQKEYEVTLREYGFAGIEAYEQPDGTTQVEFLDGYDPVLAMDYGLWATASPIGPAFEEFCEMLVREVKVLTPTEGETALDAESPSASERYVFRKSAEVWEIAHEGPKFHLSHVKGLAYIAYLLHNPHREFHILELLTAVEKTIPDDAAALYARMTKEQLAEEDLSVSRGGAFDDILDEQAKKEYRERLQTIAEEREIAEQIGDTAKVEELDRGVELIERELRTSQGLFGRKRKLGSSDEEKARSNIQQLIKLALQKVQEHDSALFDHLNSSITTGKYCAYKPETPIQWSL